MLVDTHVHVIAEDHQRYPFRPVADYRRGRLGAWHEETPVSTERLLEEMAGAGVDRAILVQPFSAYGYDNAYHADSVAAHPDRLVGICTVDPLAADAPERLSYWIRERGMHGLRLTTNREGARLDDPRTEPLWERAGALGIPVCVLTTPDHLAAVRTMAGRFATVPVALDHVGGIGAGTNQPAAVVATLLELAALPNVYLKVSTVNLAPLEAAGDEALDLWRQIVARYGARRLLWGSNYPVSQEGSYADMVALGRRALPFLSAAERESFLAGTAVHLWPQLAGTAV